MNLKELRKIYNVPLARKGYLVEFANMKAEIIGTWEEKLRLKLTLSPYYSFVVSPLDKLLLYKGEKT